MTETERTTITLSKYHMNIIKSLIGIKGNTSASVISGIVSTWVDQNLKEIKEHLHMKQIMLPPSDEEMGEKITSIINISEKIKLDDFARTLRIDRQTVIDKFPQWSKKYNIVIDGDFVFKK